MAGIRTLVFHAEPTLEPLSCAVYDRKMFCFSTVKLSKVGSKWLKASLNWKIDLLVRGILYGEIVLESGKQEWLSCTEWLLST